MQLNLFAALAATPLEMTTPETDEMEIIRVRKLSEGAVFFIEDAFSCMDEAGEDHFLAGRTFVETTRRVLKGAEGRLDIEELTLSALSCADAQTDTELQFVERSARRSARTTQEKIKAALDGRRPKRVRF